MLFPGTAPARVVRHRVRLLASGSRPAAQRPARHRAPTGAVASGGDHRVSTGRPVLVYGDIARFNLRRLRAACPGQFAGPVGQALAGDTVSRAGPASGRTGDRLGRSWAARREGFGAGYPAAIDLIGQTELWRPVRPGPGGAVRGGQRHRADASDRHRRMSLHYFVFKRFQSRAMRPAWALDPHPATAQPRRTDRSRRSCGNCPD